MTFCDLNCTHASVCCTSITQQASTWGTGCISRPRSAVGTCRAYSTLIDIGDRQTEASNGLAPARTSVYSTGSSSERSAQSKRRRGAKYGVDRGTCADPLWQRGRAELAVRTPIGFVLEPQTINTQGLAKSRLERAAPRRSPIMA